MVVTIKIDIIKVVTKYQNIIKVVRLINLRVFLYSEKFFLSYMVVTKYLFIMGVLFYYVL